MKWKLIHHKKPFYEKYNCDGFITARDLFR
jgi:hypothetical protein